MARIDTSKDFIKHTGSLKQAQKLVRSLLEEDENLAYNKGMRGNQIVYARGKQKKFDWSYNPTWKTVSVTYTDGREKPEEKEYPEYYIVWIEGVESKNGEKVLSLDSDDYEITTSMTQAMRVLPEDRLQVQERLRELGVAEWALLNCFVRVNYAPKGTLLKL